MKITKITFDNYRNLSGITLDFDLSCNFIVGENSIGKSNALKAIKKIYTLTNFQKHDFYDLTKPIVLNVEFYAKQHYDNYKGKKYHVQFYQDYGQELSVNSQDISLDNLKEQLKLISLKNETNLDNLFLEDSSIYSKDFFEYFNELDIVKRAKSFNGIKGVINYETLKNRQEVFYYPKFFIVDILLKIFKLLNECDKDYCQGIIVYSQPEQNLHPFAQKTLVKDLIRLSSGQDDGFNRFIDRHFGIKHINFQLFFKSHSDRILLNDFTKIIRFYRDDNKIGAVCGVNVGKSLRGEIHIEKQLDLQFPYFSLAIFSRCVILLEGPSEYGAMEGFANTLNIDLDYLGISVISANGEGNIPSLAELLSAFKIKVFSIRDRDNLYRQSYQDNYVTDRIDFEDEIVNSCTFADILNILDECQIDYKKTEINSASLQKRNARYSVTNKKITKNITLADCFKNKDMAKLFSLWFLTNNKSVLTGRVIGKILNENQIPSIYKKVLLKAKDYALK